MHYRRAYVQVEHACRTCTYRRAPDTTTIQPLYNQASAVPGLACYWSSWHAAARDSDEMRAFLGMEREDCCLGFFMVAACDPALKDSRTRSRETHLAVEWRS